jgi:hypothetical protein
MAKKDIITTIVIAVITLVVGFFGGMEYKAYQVRSAIAQALGQTSVYTQNSTTTASTASQHIINAKLGDDIKFQVFEIKFISLKEQNTISETTLGSFKTADSGAKFVVVDMAVTNLTNSTVAYPSSGIPLFDSKGRQYNEYTYTIGNIDNYLDGQSLTPSVAKDGVVVYEVPTDATGYYFEIAKGGTNDTYKVSLQ